MSDELKVSSGAGRLLLFLFPSILKSVLSFGTLPLTTLVLNPDDFGAVSLLTIISSFFIGLSGIGMAYPVAHRFPTSTSEEKRYLVSTLFWLSQGISVAGALFFIGIWQKLIELIPGISVLPQAAHYIGAALVLSGAAWQVASPVLVITGNAKGFALVLCAEAVAAASCTLISLFYFDMGVLSLLIGALGGGLVAAALSLAMIFPYLRMIFDTTVVRAVAKVASVATMTAMLERAFGVLERGLVARSAGLYDLGIYTHSQQYDSMAKQGVKAWNNALWPVSLREAREEGGRFPRTGKVWAELHLLLGLAGIFFATLGRDAISLLTHGKFTDAHTLVAFWMVILLVRKSANPSTAALYAHNRGVAIEWAIGLSCGVSLVALFFLVPLFGIYGAICAALIQAVILRAMITMSALRLARIPFQDQVALLAIGTIFMALGVNWFLPDLVTARLAGFASVSGALMICAWHTTRDLLSEAMMHLRMRRA